MIIIVFTVRYGKMILHFKIFTQDSKLTYERAYLIKYVLNS